jgi:hypothetical protein
MSFAGAFSTWRALAMYAAAYAWAAGAASRSVLRWTNNADSRRGLNHRRLAPGATVTSHSRSRQTLFKGLATAGNTSPAGRAHATGRSCWR